MKMRILALACVVVLMLALVPVTTFAAPEGSVTGTFSNNSPPSITSVTLWDTAVTPAETAAMTPLVKYDARVVVTDADGLTDLNTVVVKVWYDSDGGNPTEAEFNGITAGNAKTAIIITWTEGGTPPFVLTEESGSSWDMTVSDCVAPASLPGTFQFKFTVGKVATETSGLAKWQIAAKVTDDANPAQTAFSYDTTPGATMNWYGEVTVGGTVNWGTVNPGMDFAEGTPSEQPLGATITYISNGAYDEKVKSSPTWSTVATLDVTGVCNDPNEFALKADDTGTLTSAVLVDTTGVAIDDTGTQTTETGDSAANNTLWLKLASTFDKGTYSGTITYIIADGT